jgi:transcriptional regulator with XRE-family HTH domain
MVITPDTHRAFLLNFMKEHGLNTNKWAKMAGISEGTLRAYLSGRSQTISLETLSKMANAVSLPIVELIDGTFKEVNEIYFYKSVTEIDNLLSAKKIALPSEERAKLYLAWYRALNALKHNNQDLQTLMKNIIALLR